MFIRFERDSKIIHAIRCNLCGETKELEADECGSVDDGQLEGWVMVDPTRYGTPTICPGCSKLLRP